jgi:hypothetical protein
MLPVQVRLQFGCLVRCILLVVATTLLQLASYVSASGQATIVSPRALLDPISLPIYVLENFKRSPADNTTFGAGLGFVGLSTDRQCILVFSLTAMERLTRSLRSYYTVIEVGGIYFRVALDTASADLWVVSSACVTTSCKSVPSYPLSYSSPTFVSLGDNATFFKAQYVDNTCK